MNKFIEIMSEKEDFQLLEIYREKEDYTEEAIEALLAEAQKRNLDLTNCDNNEDLEVDNGMEPPSILFIKDSSDQVEFEKKLVENSIRFEKSEIELEGTVHIKYYYHPEETGELYNILDEMKLLA